jgi:hypothetical protein
MILTKRPSLKDFKGSKFMSPERQGNTTFSLFSPIQKSSRRHPFSPPHSQAFKTLQKLSAKIKIDESKIWEQESPDKSELMIKT